TTIKKVAFIHEDQCIGCTKCIQACPVDAIVGATKSMHTVIANECTGCDLCVAPCPTSCIEMIPVATTVDNWKWDLDNVQVATDAATDVMSDGLGNIPVKLLK
ncbi:MAG: RnfABCDGE type electron transport complex subunit B, partial [Aeromonas sp.]